MRVILKIRSFYEKCAGLYLNKFGFKPKKNSEVKKEKFAIHISSQKLKLHTTRISYTADQVGIRNILDIAIFFRKAKLDIRSCDSTRLD